MYSFVSQNSGDLSAKKGELVKITNSVIEKKLCVAVKTNGDSGTIRKKNIQQVVPGEEWGDDALNTFKKRRILVIETVRPL